VPSGTVSRLPSVGLARTDPRRGGCALVGTKCVPPPDRVVH
jgi:hypothetical protein